MKNYLERKKIHLSLALSDTSCQLSGNMPTTNRTGRLSSFVNVWKKMQLNMKNRDLNIKYVDTLQRRISISQHIHRVL